MAKNGTKIIKPRQPKGMADILPEQMIKRQYVMEVIRTVFEEFGFEPLQTPALELSATLKGKYGEDAERLIYDAQHEGGKEKLSLRYDLSVPLCRVVAMHDHKLIKPFKRYHIAPVWRADRPQKGRYREFYQCDADTVGSTSMLADAEIINVIYEILTRLGFKNFVVNISNRKLLNGIGKFSGVPDNMLPGLYRSIDKLDKIGLDGVRTELREMDKEGSSLISEEVINSLLDLLQIKGTNRDILTQLRKHLTKYPEAVEGIDELESIIEYLEELGISEQCYQIVPSMVRGLEYYTGPIFETTVKEPTNMPSITGGGRFDNLVGMFMDKSYPAVGTTVGIERIILAMDEQNMFPPDIGKTVTQVLVTVFDNTTVKSSLQMATTLRKAGLKTELYFESGPIRDQIGYANKKSIPFIVILGPDEISKGQAVVRTLGTREQQTVDFERVPETIQQQLS